MERTYIDIFAGCGGISLGLFNSEKWRGLFAVEKSEFAFATLEHNLIEKESHFDWPLWLEQKAHDINELLESHKEELISLRGTVDLVVGGPPCQGFSVAGKREESDERNKLFESYLTFIEYVQPTSILFENVKGFDLGFKKDKDSNRGKAYSRILIERLAKLGYPDAKHRVLNFKNFGVPQSRERVIVVASKKFSGVQFFDELESQRSSFLEEKGLSEQVTIEDAISDLLKSAGTFPSPDSVGFEAGKYKNPKSRYQEIMRAYNPPEKPDSHRFANHSDHVAEKFRVIIKEKLSSSQVRERFNTKKSRTKLLEANKPSQTLTTLPDDYVHYREPRILTVREYARIQSFNDWYEIKKKYTTGGFLRKQQVPRYSQIGNAVPPLFAELAGRVISTLENTHEKSTKTSIQNKRRA